MHYHEYRFEFGPATNSDILLGLLSIYPFDTFQEGENTLGAFVKSGFISPEEVAEIGRIADRCGATLTHVEHAPQNWNAVWESNFEPLRIDDFVGLRADFHPPTEQVRFDLVINPKMAFGTGHHATTDMMIRSMRELNFTDKTVFDYGCGTGVLAILAKKLGAGHTVAVDIEPPSYENTLENMRTNGVNLDDVILGTLADVPPFAFDLILANINRNVILNSLPELHRYTAPGTLLITSGYRTPDTEMVDQALAQHGFQQQGRREREGWVCTVSVRT